MAEFSLMCCGECGIEFQVPQHFYDNRRKNGKGWYCPNGHSRVFRESEADKYRREAERLRQQLAEKDDAISHRDRQLVAARGQITKLNNRAAHGVCPCCSRTFKQLASHMKSKHPDFVAKPDLKLVAS